MFGLPWATHRYLIEPLTGDPHVSRILVSRFLSFLNKVESCKKTPLQTLLNIVKNDVRSITGSNIRKILLNTGKRLIGEVRHEDMSYHDIPPDEAWRVDLLKELLEVKHEDLHVPGWDQAELDQILNHLCTE